MSFTSARINPPFNTLFLTQQELLLLYAHLAGVHHAGEAKTRLAIWDKVRSHLGVAPIDSNHVQKALGSFDKAYKSYDQHRAIIADLLKALHGDWTCQVTYRTPDGDGPRTYLIEPYELTEYEGGLYLYCRNPRRNQVFPLAVERIQTLKLNDDNFHRTKTVEQTIRDKKERAFGIYDDEVPLDVKLKFTPAVAFYVRERTWHPTQKLTRHKDGSLTMTFTASGRIEIERWIRGWGEEVRIVSKAPTH